MINDIKYQEFYEDIYNFYCENIHDVSMFSMKNIYITDNMKNLLELRELPTTDVPLGATVLPYEKCQDMTILIEISGECNYEDARRFIHELTHAYDFIQYALYNHNGVIKNFRNEKFFYTYSMFSEFKAHLYDEIYPFIYQASKKGVDIYDYVMSEYVNSCKTYFESIRKNLASYQLTVYELFKTFGKIYAIDEYDNIQDIENSSAYIYIPLIFKTHTQKVVMEMYKVCFFSLKYNEIFDNLQTLDELINSISIDVD